MNLTRKQKAIYSGAVLWIVFLLGFFVVSPIVNLLLGVLYIIGWVLLLRFTNPQVQHLPPVERFGLGSDVVTTDRTDRPGRPAPPDELPSVIVPDDPEEQARLAEARREREAERAEARRRRDAAKAAEKERKRAERDKAEAARREQDEARAERERLEREAKASRAADELELRQAEEQAAREAEALAQREAEALSRREAEIEARREAEQEVERRAEAEEASAARARADQAVIDEQAVQSDQDILAASGVAALDEQADPDAESQRKAELLDKVRSRLHDYE